MREREEEEEKDSICRNLQYQISFINNMNLYC
jgi:hypothetical protein